MAEVGKDGLGNNPLAIIIPGTDQFWMELSKRLDDLGINYAILLENGYTTLYVADFDGVNVRGIVEHLKHKEAQTE